MKGGYFAILLVFAASVSAQSPIGDSQLRALIAQDSSAVVLDVRTLDEWDEGHLPFAKLLPVDQIQASAVAALVPTKATPVVVYCRSGRRSAVAAERLLQLGYTNVRDLGALTNWKGPFQR